MLRSGDMTDLKQYNAMMRQLLDRYVKAPRSEVLAKLEDLTFLQLIEDEQQAEEIADELTSEESGEPSVAETIASNVRHYIVRKRDMNPDYFDKLSEKINKLLEDYRNKAIAYREMLVQLLMDVARMHNLKTYPSEIDTPLKKALYDNLGEDAGLAMAVYDTVELNALDDWRNLPPRRKKLQKAVKECCNFPDDKLNVIMGIISANDEF